MKEFFLVRHLMQIFGAVFLATTLCYIPFLVFIPETRQNSLAITVFLVFVLVFEIEGSIAKHRSMKKNMNLELSRLRRVHHLAEHMASQHTVWFENISAALHGYHQFFKTHDFGEYSKAGKKFRDITRLVYSFTPRNKRQELLFAELLETTRELAATRQQNAALVMQRISSYQWIVLLIVETLVIISALLTQGPGVVAYFVNVSLLSAVFLVTILIWEVDDYNANELRQFSSLYVDNRHGLGHRK